jgi:flagellar basal body-associated protein FliL
MVVPTDTPTESKQMSEVTKHKVRHAISQVFVLIGLVATTIVVFAGIYWMIEDYAFYQCVEWAIQTVTSTGYGNYGATGVAGSVLADILMLWGVFILLGIVTAVIVNILKEDPDHFSHEEQEQIKADLIEIKRLLKERGDD